MAGTVSKKRLRKTRVADLTTDEFQAMLESLMDRKLAEWSEDPRIQRRRREIAAHAQATRAEYRSGKVRRGTARDLMADL